MTALVAIRKKIGEEFKTVYGTDTLITAGFSKIKQTESAKVVEFKNFVVLYAGDASIHSVLDKMSKNRGNKKFLKISSQADALEFGRLFVINYKEHLAEFINKDDHDSQFILLIITEDAFYSLDSFGTVSTNFDYVAGGDGEELILGGLFMAYEAIETENHLFDVAKRSLNAAVAFNTSCGGNLIVRKLGE